jgi:hypothetical protein
MAEFKKLSEVEQVETASDNATVLIEEGGEIKRVAKSEVGGNGGGGYIIHLGQNSVSAEGQYFYVCMDNYDELYDILVAGGTVWIDYTDAPQYAEPKSITDGMAYIPDATNMGPASHMAGMWFLTDVGLVVCDTLYFMMSDGEAGYIIFPNGSHNLESGDR